MSEIIVTLRDEDGNVIEPNSARTFHETARAAERALEELDYVDGFVPDILRANLQDVKRAVSSFRADANSIHEDLIRYGDLDTALQERAFRQGSKR